MTVNGSRKYEGMSPPHWYNTTQREDAVALDEEAKAMGRMSSETKRWMMEMEVNGGCE